MEKTLQIKITADGKIALDEIKATGKAMADVGKSESGTTQSTRELAGELDALMKRISSTYRETQRLAEGQATLRKSYRAGLIDIDQYKQGLALLSNENQKAAHSGDRLAGALGKISHYGLAAIGITQFAGLAKSIVQASLNFEKYNNTLIYATGSQQAAAVEMDYITRTADQLGLKLEGAIVGFTKFSAATRGSAIEGEKTRQVFESVARASVVMGLSADETNGALLAISQMVSKGTVQAEELRGQLGERLPGAFNVAARAMGVTTQELGKLLEDGAVVSDEFLPKFADELNRTLGDNPQSAASSAQAQLNRLSNAYLEFKRSLGESLLMELVLRVTEGSTDALKWFNHFVFDKGELADLNARANAPARLAKLDRERQLLLDGGNSLDPANTLARRQARLAAIEAEVKAIRKRARLDQPVEDVGAAESARNATALRDKAQQNALDKYINTEKWQTKSQKLASALDEERKAFEKLVEGMEKDSPRYQAAYEAHLSHIDVIKGKAEASAKTSAKKSTSDPLANAMRQLENARAESGRHTEKFIYDAELKALDTSLQQALISYQDYYAQREAIEDDYYSRQASRIEQKIANEQAAATAARARGDKVGAVGNETNIVRLQAELNALDQQRANSRAANIEAERQAELEMARQGMAMTAQLLQAQGQLEDAARLQVAQKYSASLARMKAEGNEAGVELIEKLINVELASGRLNQIETELNAALTRITDETKRVDIQKNTGILTEFEARRKLIALQQQEIPLRQAQLTALEQAYAQSPTRELSDKIRQAQLDIEQLQAVVSGANRTFEYGARTAIGEYRDAISNGATQARDLFNSSFQSMESVLANFFRTGKLNMQDFFSALEQSLAKVAAQKMMEGMFSAMDFSGMGSWFGSGSTGSSNVSSGIQLVGTNHTGGILGSESTALRYVSSDVFDGAPRFHTGGILGDEIPIIGRKGEGVFTAEQMKNLAPVGTGSQQVVNVQIYEAQGTQATVTQSTGDNGELNLQVMVETLTDMMGRDIERGRGLGPTLEAKYGLNPSAGALG